MTVGAEMKSQGLKAPADAWARVFRLDDPMEPSSDMNEFLRHHEIVRVDRDSIFTARLPQTRNFCSSMQNGQVRLFTPSIESFDFQSCLDLLALVNTHGRMARTGIARMRPPAFWIRAKSGTTAVLPVLPLQQLCILTGWDERQTRSRLTPLIEDGAIRALRCQDRSLGLIAESGFAEDGLSRRFMRF